MKLLQLNTLTKEFADTLKSSFDNLPETSHKDGKYRLRRYSVVELRTTFWTWNPITLPAYRAAQVEITHLPTRSFKQDKGLNSHQGGMSRLFEEIGGDTLQSKGMKEACLAFKRANDLSDGVEVEIHQMRVRTLPDTIWTPVAPEGIHQDGFDYIAVLGINRLNIHGGELMVYRDKNFGPFMTYQLRDGEMATLKDRELWHNATPISRRDEDEEGYGDWFVFCANNYEK
jgi:hypothetical protein